MAQSRIGRPAYLADTALSVLLGGVGGLVVTAVLLVTGFPEWGETLLSFLVVFVVFRPVGLGIRLLMHGGYAFINRGLEPSADEGDMSREKLVTYSRPWMRFGAGSAGAAVVVSLAFLLRTGEAFPG